MLVPAITKKHEIEERIKELFYTTDMMFETGSMDNWIPDISENPNESTFQFAIVDSKHNLLGYFTYCIDWYSSCASRFGVISFDKGNPIVGRDLIKEMKKLLYDYNLHRIEWRMISGNPIEKHYDKFCFKYNGNKHILKDVFKDRFGNYHNDVIYEIIRGAE